jgi:hypothetical protein
MKHRHASCRPARKLSHPSLHHAVTLVTASFLAAYSSAAPVTAGNTPVALQPVLTTTATAGIFTPGIDLNIAPGDTALFTATVGGQILRTTPTGSTSVFLSIPSITTVPFTTNFAGGLTNFTFHPGYADPASPGHRKLYTFNTDWKTTQQRANGTTNPPASTTTPGNTLTGLPDFWSPEMYAPATSGNPLTAWTNPDSPSSGNTDFTHFNVVREWTVNSAGTAVDTNITPRTILRMAHGFQGKGSHNGGALRFGPDGFLYLTTGDGGGNAGQDHDGGINNGEDGHTNSTGNGQDKSVVYGKVLRIDPIPASASPSVLSPNGQYRIPTANPFRDSAGPNVDEIYAFGFRNPWKMNFDSLPATFAGPAGTGSLYLSDVGQHHREEINIITAGSNYGWGYLQGNVRLVSEQSATGAPDAADLIDGTNGTPVRVPAAGWAAFEATATAPLVDYLTRRQTVNGVLVGDGTAVTAGFIYRGSALPQLYGKYVFGDYSIAGSPPPGLTANKARLFYLDPASPSVIQEFPLAAGSSLLGQLLSIGQDSSGELYAAFDNGNVTRIVSPHTWNANASATFSTPANWTAAVPTTGQTANFGPVITAPRTITLDTPANLGSLHFDSQNPYTLTGQPITLSGGQARITIAAGSHTIAAPITTGDLEIATAAGSSLILAANLTATSLILTPGSTVNTTTADLLINYTGASPISTLIAYLNSSQLIAKGDFNGLPTTLAISEATDLGLTEFNGIAVDDTTVILKFTFVGDANLDGQVDALDYERIDLAIGNSGALGTAQGDLNYDGNVDALDYEQVDLNIGNGVGAPLATQEAARFIPEPTLLTPLALAALSLRRRLS